MDFAQLAKERYSVRKFQDKKIEKELLDQVILAGRVAPTACNNQPQKVYVLESEEALEKLKKVTPCHFNAPAALLICYDETLSWKRSYDGTDSGFVDGSIVTTHMMLQAHELGLGTTWVMYFDPAAAVKEYALPENIIPVAILPIGYPAQDAEPAPMHEKVRAEEETVEYR